IQPCSTQARPSVTNSASDHLFQSKPIPTCQAIRLLERPFPQAQSAAIACPPLRRDQPILAIPLCPCLAEASDAKHPLSCRINSRRSPRHRSILNTARCNDRRSQEIESLQ